MNRPLNRPLRKRVSEELDWSMNIYEMPHTGDTSYPVFEWIFGKEVIGSKLRAWPFQGIFVLDVRREQDRFCSVEKLLIRLNSYGWGEPPHIDEVFKDIMETKEMLPIKDIEGFREVSDKLRQKWEGLVASIAV